MDHQQNKFYNISDVLRKELDLWRGRSRAGVLMWLHAPFGPFQKLSKNWGLFKVLEACKNSLPPFPSMLISTFPLLPCLVLLLSPLCPGLPMGRGWLLMHYCCTPDKNSSSTGYVLPTSLVPQCLLPAWEQAQEGETCLLLFVLSTAAGQE